MFDREADVREPHPHQLRILRGVAVGFASLAAALSACSSPSKAAEPLKFNNCKPTFGDDFQKLDVSHEGPGTKWIAHTPWFGDFGDARFTDPGPDSAFSTGPNGLTITASKGPDGKWKSGLLSSADSKGGGFSAAHGYFEMVSTFPPGPGTWPAFWMVTADPKADPAVEIDTIEYYGRDPKSYQITVTVRPKNNAPGSHSAFTHVPVPDGSLVSGPHAYGMSLGTKEIVFYLDRKEVWRTPVPPEQTKPVGMLLNLALGSGWPIKDTPNPSKMLVKSVSYYPSLEACGVPPAAAGD